MALRTWAAAAARAPSAGGRAAPRKAFAAAHAALATLRSSALVAAAGSSSACFQQPLSGQEKKAKRADAQRLGRTICTVNLGQKGLTPAFLEGFRTALSGNELVKVRVGGCDDSPEEVAEALCRAGDCVVVHKIGFTLTFFRDAALPPPPPLRAERHARPAAPPAGKAAAGGAIDEEGGDGEEDEEVEGALVIEVDEELAAYLESEDAFSDSDSEGEEAEEEEEDLGRPNSSRRQAANARAARVGRKPPPPEFTVIS